MAKHQLLVVGRPIHQMNAGRPIHQMTFLSDNIVVCSQPCSTRYALADVKKGLLDGDFDL